MNSNVTFYTQTTKTYYLIVQFQGADKTVKAPSGESTLECAESEDMKALLR